MAVQSTGKSTALSKASVGTFFCRKPSCSKMASGLGMRCRRGSFKSTFIEKNKWTSAPFCSSGRPLAAFVTQMFLLYRKQKSQIKKSKISGIQENASRREDTRSGTEGCVSLITKGEDRKKASKKENQMRFVQEREIREEGTKTKTKLGFLN